MRGIGPGEEGLRKEDLKGVGAWGRSSEGEDPKEEDLREEEDLRGGRA